MNTCHPQQVIIGIIDKLFYTSAMIKILYINGNLSLLQFCWQAGYFTKDTVNTL